MEVPSEVLQKIVCERCGGYLSRGPVHLVENTKYRCGRCQWTEGDQEEGIRVEAYEELAKLMSFPCMYKENGCTSKVPFMDNERHEETCQYREYHCPITESGQCEWTGHRKEVLDHCQQDHPTKIVENPCRLTYDITRPSFNSYILFAFEVLFLIQSKVCTATRNIYHAVRLIDDSARATDFKFSLKIENTVESAFRSIRKEGKMMDSELLELEEGTAVVTGINSLQAVLGDMTESRYTVTVKRSDLGTSRSTLNHVIVWCDECKTETEPVYRANWLCRNHAPPQRMCQRSALGCTSKDFHNKCATHESFFCPYKPECDMCLVNITGTTLYDHYTQAHGDLTLRAGTAGTINPTIIEDDNMYFSIFGYDFGRVVCTCMFYESGFELWVYTAIPSAQFHTYRCTAELSHPHTGHTLTCKLAVSYNGGHDWYMRIPLAEYNACVHDTLVNIKINFCKISDPSQYIVQDFL